MWARSWSSFIFAALAVSAETMVLLWHSNVAQFAKHGEASLRRRFSAAQ